MKKNTKKKTEKVVKPIIEFKPTGKKTWQGWDIHHLCINGKVVKKDSCFDGNMFLCNALSENILETLLPMACKSFPDNTVCSFDFKAHPSKGTLFNEGGLWIEKLKNRFVLYLYFDSDDMRADYDPVHLYQDDIMERLGKEISKDKTGRLTLEDNDVALVVQAAGKPDETVQQLLDRLMSGLAKHMKKVKALTLKKIKEMERDVKADSIKWGKYI